MLTETFIHVHEIGQDREKALWRAGFCNWWDVMSAADSDIPPGVPLSYLRRTVEQSVVALGEGDWGYFREGLKGHYWRALSLLPGGSGNSSSGRSLRVLALDIETEGISKEINGVTAVGVCGDATGMAPLALLPASRSFRDELFGVLEETDLLVTYNGTQFDVPFLQAQPFLRGIPVPPLHVDLRFLFSSLGITGGLKRVQVQMGYQREGALADVDGYMAVLLWQEHLRRVPGALDTLVRYCLEDVVVLLDLAPLGYNMHAANLGRPWRAKGGPSISLDSFPYDPAIISRLKERTGGYRHR